MVGRFQFACFALLAGVFGLLLVPQRGSSELPSAAPLAAAGSTTVAEPIALPSFEIVSIDPSPVICEDTKGVEGNKYGFEGGCVLRMDSSYQLFVAEQCGDPMVVKMRLAHWQSPDGYQWKRISTLYESSGEFTGKDVRASMWSPMPIYDESEKRWNFFYVTYRSKPNSSAGWYLAYEGRVWRAVSKTLGPGGYGGPYQDIGVILQPGPDSGPWEGLQGTDSFYPYQLPDGRWFAFFGSALTEKPRNTNFPKWNVGLASADKLEGPWRRRNDLNPLTLDPYFTENPVVTRLDDGFYVAVVDGGNRMGYTISKDGVNWSRAVFPPIPETVKAWWKTMRTPLSLIAETNGSYTVFFTAFYGKKQFAAVGRAVFRRNQ